MAVNKIALSIQAHPDDAEFTCVGAFALLRKKGWQIHIATMTPGDAGSAEYNREEISRIRKNEAANSAKILDGDYHCLECDDVFIMYDRGTLLKAIELVRKVKPTIVFAPGPTDYMVDHTTTSKIAMTACFACGMPNIEIAGTKPFESVPYLYYVDAVEGKDILGNEIEPAFTVDITTVIDTKEKMLCCHESQRNWLLSHHGVDEYILAMKRFARKRATLAGIGFAEGFRQHLGHAFPQDNILISELGKLVHTI